MKPLNGTNLFTCTFCYHLCVGPPCILGRSARLACSSCSAAVLDLSICWVCGEIIFRGDECVSLGWCFWHRACYGCLLCGSRAICRGTPVKELFDDVSECGRGREVMEPPLCAFCAADVGVYGVSEDVIVQKGLRRMERVDGGLTRKRWESRRNVGEEAQYAGKGASDNSRGFAYDGSHDVIPLPVSTIWVNLLDPVNSPSFQPRPLKPIPEFMQRTSSLTFPGRQQPFLIDSPTRLPLRSRTPSIYDITDTSYYSYDGSFVTTTEERLED